MDKGPLYFGRSRIARVAISCYTVLLLIIQYDTYNMMNKDIFSQIIMALSNALRAAAQHVSLDISILSA